jgi:hypothetical protein
MVKIKKNEKLKKATRGGVKKSLLFNKISFLQPTVAEFFLFCFFFCCFYISQDTHIQLFFRDFYILFLCEM